MKYSLLKTDSRLLKSLSVLLVVFASNTLEARMSDAEVAISQRLSLDFSKDLNEKQLKKIRSKVLDLGPKATPLLIEVAKTSSYPTNSRWHSLFLLGQVMGKKASSFVAGFLKHPHWMLRLGALKVLLNLKQRRFQKQYEGLLTDEAMVVRTQALENLTKLSLKDSGRAMWKMVFDSRNYVKTNGKFKRTEIITKVLKSLGEIRFTPLKKTFVKMLNSEKYQDLHLVVDESLRKMTGMRSPAGRLIEKRKFWNAQVKQQIQSNLRNPKNLRKKSEMRADRSKPKGDSVTLR